MAIRQISVFIENQQGNLVSTTKAIADADLNIRALSIADTKDFGILRLITSDADKTIEVLSKENIINTTVVVAAKLVAMFLTYSPRRASTSSISTPSPLRRTSAPTWFSAWTTLKKRSAFSGKRVFPPSTRTTSRISDHQIPYSKALPQIRRERFHIFAVLGIE